MTKDHAQGVFIRFIDFRGELLLRASAIDGVTPAGKNGADEATLRLSERHATACGTSVPDRTRNH